MRAINRRLEGALLTQGGDRLAALVIDDLLAEQRGVQIILPDAGQPGLVGLPDTVQHLRRRGGRAQRIQGLLTRPAIAEIRIRRDIVVILRSCMGQHFGAIPGVYRLHVEDALHPLSVLAIYVVPKLEKMDRALGILAGRVERAGPMRVHPSRLGEHRVPDLVRELQIDPEVLVQIVVEETRHLSRIGIADRMRHRQPDILMQQIAEFHHVFDRHPGGARLAVPGRARAVTLPDIQRLGGIGAAPVEEANRLERAQSLQEPGIECPLTSDIQRIAVGIHLIRPVNPDIANRVFHPRLGQVEPDIAEIGGLNRKADLTRLGQHRGHRNRFDLAGALVEQDIIARRHVAVGRNDAAYRLGPQGGGERHLGRITVRVDRHLRQHARIPRRGTAGVEGQPGPRALHVIAECPLAGIVIHPVQVHAQIEGIRRRSPSRTGRRVLAHIELELIAATGRPRHGQPIVARRQILEHVAAAGRHGPVLLIQ